MVYNHPGARRAVIYRTRDGSEPYSGFVDGLRDRAGAASIRARVRRAELGNLGDFRGVGEGVIELRIHHGPGYRVYAGMKGKDMIVLLCAGDKGSQDEDIDRALGFWRDLKRGA